MKNSLDVAEFFSGIGLMRVGLEGAGWRVVWANDIDPDKCDIYQGHFGDVQGHLCRDDVHAVDAKSIPPVALATASFPCNDLSLAGSRQGLQGKHSSAFWGFYRVLSEMRPQPPLVLLENVAGFLSSNDGEDLRQVCLSLNKLGYAVDAFIIDAALFVPQSRKRLFLVGSLEKRKPELVAETDSFYQSQLRPSALADFILCNPDINWSIRNLPDIKHVVTRLDDILEDVPETSPLWWSSNRAEYLLNQMSDKHRKVANNMILGEVVSYGTVFRRVRGGRSMAELRTDGIAGCLRTPRGGSGRQILFAAGHGRYAARLLTPRECARLMGADDFAIATTSNKALFGFGDAVCVPVVKWIGKNYLYPVWKELYAAREKTKRQPAHVGS